METYVNTSEDVDAKTAIRRAGTAPDVSVCYAAGLLFMQLDQQPVIGPTLDTEMPLLPLPAESEEF